MTLTMFQERVRRWVLDCFGKEIAQDTTERSYRFLEEALELVQSCNCTKEEALKLVDYVYSRSIGEVTQELGGTMVTLAALASANGLSLKGCSVSEIKRCEAKTEKIRAKHFSKDPNIRSSLPGKT